MFLKDLAETNQQGIEPLINIYTILKTGVIVLPHVIILYDCVRYYENITVVIILTVYRQ